MENVPVYAEDLKTIVGAMMPGRGFVPTGADLKDYPLVMPTGVPMAEGK